jgi:adenylylsulfate kinase
MNNIIKQEYTINRRDYEKRNRHKSFVLWFTGLSGSGKSTIANALNNKLFDLDIHSIVLDGDNTRIGINKDLSFSKKDRAENIRRVSEISKLFIDKGQIAITAFISPFTRDREIASGIISKNNFIEVFVDCPIEECEKRDVKGLYKKAKEGLIKDFTGISSPFESPKNPDIHLNTENQNLTVSVDLILKYLKQNKWLHID